MAILYQTIKFKSANIFAMAILGLTIKFNSRQYFRLYGNVMYSESNATSCLMHVTNVKHGQDTKQSGLQGMETIL